MRSETLNKKDSIIIVIPTYGRGSLLNRTLESLSKCVFPSNYLKTIVIENGEKGDAEIVCSKYKNIGCEYQYSAQANKSDALNKALDTIENDIFIIFFDDDIRVSPEVITAYASAFEEYGLDYFYGGPYQVDYELRPEPYYIDFMPVSASGWEKAKNKKLSPIDLIGFNWAAHSSQLKKAGGFDINFGPNSATGATGQEHDMMVRLDNLGINPWYVEDAKVWHYVPKERATFNWLINRKFKAGISAGLKSKSFFTPVMFTRVVLKEVLFLLLNLFTFSKKKLAGSYLNLHFYRGVYHSFKLK
ncbi:glycosyltransferase [Pontibacter arcticus]|uniref:Glycosyltransferase 2-like domain-containing protein n=1 Tax=Pontibacter arcticus TaxID=2080288 RepID=A0A364RG69_9BACT|nr:glycosyltransferase family A protein [Pontibacter arcticus]RAU83291.1 hypothetical protein DP923_08775 [Pontibacter arcticus]